MIITSADSQGLLLHMPPPMLSGIPMSTHTISYAIQNYQTLEQFLESLYDRELLAIMRALDAWRHYLLSSPTTVQVFTDHKNLTYFCQH